MMNRLISPLIPALCIALAAIGAIPARSAEPASRATIPLDAAARATEWHSLGLVDIQEIDTTLVVRLEYATRDNFMGKDVYHGLKTCWLQREAAWKLHRAEDILIARSSGLRILVADGLRPRSVQREMWNLVRGTPAQPYVADPSRGSMHNYGVAVDATLVDAATGIPLDMGCPMDSFGPIAQPREEGRLLAEGKLTAEQLANRRLLREVMVAAGFRPLDIEWWHFDAFDKASVRRHFPIVE